MRSPPAGAREALMLGPSRCIEWCAWLLSCRTLPTSTSLIHPFLLAHRDEWLSGSGKSPSVKPGPISCALQGLLPHVWWWRPAGFLCALLPQHAHPVHGCHSGHNLHQLVSSRAVQGTAGSSALHRSCKHIHTCPRSAPEQLSSRGMPDTFQGLHLRLHGIGHTQQACA